MTQPACGRLEERVMPDVKLSERFDRWYRCGGVVALADLCRELAERVEKLEALEEAERVATSGASTCPACSSPKPGVHEPGCTFPTKP